MSNSLEKELVVPSHVAIIMDGNRRWAKAHGLQILQGHQKVAREIIKRLVKQSIKRGVKYLTLWAFSTENWHRDKTEIQGLMALFRESFGQNATELHELGVKLNLIGDLESFPPDIQAGVKNWLEKTNQNKTITVTLALGYGGRDEILRAVKKLIVAKTSGLEITEDLISQTLDTAGLPDPDLIIRPGGEKRLSGFLTWQSVYSELYFSPILMPDFDEAAFDAALAEYTQRARRFGT
jgi:undecaprenyl diphosphate synthase